MEQTYLKINPADTVVVCLAEKKKGDIIEAVGPYKRCGDEYMLVPLLERSRSGQRPTASPPVVNALVYFKVI